MPVNIVQTGGNTYRTKVVNKDVEYDFEVDIKPQDIVDYLIPKEQAKKIEITNLVYIKEYMRKVIEWLNEKDSIIYEQLENDEYFVEYMKERYEDIALESWEEENAEY